MRPPLAINGNYLGRIARLRWRVGMVPWRRCPNGQHTLRAIYGDEIHAAGGNRVRCEDCTAMWPTLEAFDRGEATDG